MTNDQNRFNFLALRWVELLVIVAILLLSGWTTHQRNLVWKDEFSLWSDVVKKSPDKARPHNQLGVVLTDNGKYDEAIAEITHAISINPHPKRYVAIGNAYIEKGLLDLALAQYYKALSLKPDFFEVYVNIGNVYVKKGLIDQAIAEYKEAVTLQPFCVKAYINLASAYGLKGLYNNAIYYLRKVLELDPYNPDAHYNLGVTYYSLGLVEESIAEYEKVLGVRPDDEQALNNLKLAKSKILKQDKFP
jgi:tetratricopeptide (TPR) repeat protein